MQVKIFRAANLQAALEEIREQLGPNASVLKTRQCRDGWMGWLGRSYVEVTATSEVDVDQTHQADLESEFSDSLRYGHRSTDHFSHHPSTANVRSGRPIDSRPATLPNLRPEFGRTVSDPLDEYRSGLISLGVNSEVAERWLRATRGFVAPLDTDRFNTPWLEHLQRSVARDIKLSGPIQLHPGQRRVVALVGPTGVGKTTTAAKLAAGFRIGSKRRVGLLTIDTFRIAAVQQLQAYAQIMDLPMVVVESAEQMRGAIDKLGDVDLVLIDTAGRSPKGDMHIESLANSLRCAQPDETHLVISATSTSAVVQSAIEGFAATRPTSAILTKLDETPYTAAVLSAITDPDTSPGLPISYITNGQHVPEDIAVPSAEMLIERLLPTAVELPRIEAA